MASNMSESDESGNDVDIDEEVIVPRPHYNSIWDCPHINKFTLEENGVVKNGWRCNWCMMLWLPGRDVCPCTGIIPKTFMHGYKDSRAAASGERCPSLHRQYSRNYCAWV